MEKPTIEQITTSLTDKFGSAILSVEQQYDFPLIIVDKKELKEIVRHLYDSDYFQFRYLTTACGIHYPGTELPFAMMYQLHSLVHNIRIRFKTFTKADDVTFDSFTSIFSAANWMEREAYDFYGFIFKDHPNLKRILNVDDMDYFPMRKEYPVEDQTRYDKDDTFFGREPANYKKLI